MKKGFLLKSVIAVTIFGAMGSYALIRANALDPVVITSTQEGNVVEEVTDDINLVIEEENEMSTPKEVETPIIEKEKEVSPKTSSGEKGEHVTKEMQKEEPQKQTPVPIQKTEPTPTYKPTRDIMSLVKPSIVYATLNIDDDIFAKGEVVQILMEQGNGSFYEVAGNGKKGQVLGESLDFTNDPATNFDKLTVPETEYFVNTKGFASGTKYFIWVDIDRQLLNVFTGSKGNWKLVEQMVCATGTNKTPTKRGTFTIADRGESYVSYGTYGAKNWVRFSGSYLIQSVPFENGKIADPTLGKRVGNGNVKLSVDKSEWIYNNIPSGTAIWSN